MTETIRTEFIRTVASAGTPVRLTANTIVNIARVDPDGDKCVFATTNHHGAVPGSIVVVTGANEFNGELVVTEVVDATSFIAMVPGSNNPGVVSYACYFKIRFRHAIVIGKKNWRTPNTGNVYIGGSSVANEQAYDIEPYSAGGIGEIKIGDSASDIYENLSNYWLDAATNGDGVIVRYL